MRISVYQNDLSTGFGDFDEFADESHLFLFGDMEEHVKADRAIKEIVIEWKLQEITLNIFAVVFKFPVGHGQSSRGEIYTVAFFEVLRKTDIFLVGDRTTAHIEKILTSGSMNFITRIRVLVMYFCEQGLRSSKILVSFVTPPASSSQPFSV